MDTKERALEVKVGLFTIIGLVICGALLVYFGKIREPFQETYMVTVHFADASGLQKGAYVMMAGARIGRVSEKPVLPPNRDGVVVPLRIFTEAQIPVGSTFRVKTQGLLGDAYVDVEPRKGDPVDGFLVDGAMVKGEREGGFAEITASGAELVDNLKVTNEELRKLLVKINEDVLAKEFIADIHNAADGASDFGNVLRERGRPSFDTLQASLDNFKATTENLKEVSQSMEGTAQKLDANMDQISGVLVEVDAAVASANAVLNSANSGKGPLPALLNDQGTREELQDAIGNLKSFSENVRKHGVLFYKDSAPRPAEEGEPQPAPAKKPRPKVPLIHGKR